MIVHRFRGDYMNITWPIVAKGLFGPRCDLDTNILMHSGTSITNITVRRENEGNNKNCLKSSITIVQ